ncbi:MAG TPA: hypothetical protein VF681_11665 [Abditibacteriaceae bacterium]
MTFWKSDALAQPPATQPPAVVPEADEMAPPAPKARPVVAEISPAEAERLAGGATFITFDMANAHPREVFAEFAKQSRLKFEPAYGTTPQQIESFWDREFPRVTLRFQRTPFWSAIAEFSQHFNFNLEWRPVTQTFAISQGPSRSQFSGLFQTVGPFQVRATSTSSTRNAQLQLGTETPIAVEEVQSAWFRVYPDPRLLPFILWNGMTNTFDDITDEQGRNILNPPFEPSNIFGNGPHIGTGISWMREPDRKRIARIHGSVQMQLVLRRERWEIPITLDAAGKPKVRTEKIFTTSQGPIKFLVEFKAKENRAGERTVYGMHLSLPADADWKAPEWVLWHIVPPHELRVEDAEGRALFDNGSGGGNSQEWESNWSSIDALNERKVGAPTKIVLGIPVDVRKLQVPFEFRDLPVP